MEAELQKLTNLELKLDNSLHSLSQNVYDLKSLVSQTSIIRNDIKLLNNMIEQLTLFANEQDRRTDRRYLLEKIATHIAISDNFNSCLRKAQLEANQHIVEQREKDKEELLAPALQAKQIEAKQEFDSRNAINASEEITVSLQRNNELLMNEIEQSRHALEVLESSGGVLRKTFDQHKTISGSVKTGHNYVIKEKRRERTDQVILYFGFFCFLLAVFWIIKKRLLSRLPLPFLGS